MDAWDCINSSLEPSGKVECVVETAKYVENIQYGELENPDWRASIFTQQLGDIGDVFLFSWLCFLSYDLGIIIFIAVSQDRREGKWKGSFIISITVMWKWLQAQEWWGFCCLCGIIPVSLKINCPLLLIYAVFMETSSQRSL